MKNIFLSVLMIATMCCELVSAQERYPFPTEDSPIVLDSAEGFQLIFFEYSKGNSSGEEIIFLEGILISPDDDDKVALLGFSCNLSVPGLLSIGVMNSEGDILIEGQEQFPADTLQLFRYSYCEEVTSDTVVEERAYYELPAENCTTRIVADSESFPCNYLAFTVGQNFLNYHHVLRVEGQRLYSVSYVVSLQSLESVLHFMISAEGREPLVVDARGQCRKERFNSQMDKLTCRAILPEGESISEAIVPRFNLQQVVNQMR